ncbi:MAG: Beta-galactosidase C-terminal domain [Mobilitalea sp.]
MSVREKDGKTYIFVLNYAHATTEIMLKKEMTDIDTE